MVRVRLAFLLGRENWVEVVVNLNPIFDVIPWSIGISWLAWFGNSFGVRCLGLVILDNHRVVCVLLGNYLLKIESLRVYLECLGKRLRHHLILTV